MCVFGCNLPPTTLLAVTGIFYVLDYFCNTGWNEYRNKSQHRKLTHEKKILPPLLQGLEPATVRLLVRFLPPPVHVLFSFLVCVTPPRFTRRRSLGRLSVVKPVTKNMLSALFLSSTARPVFHIRFLNMRRCGSSSIVGTLLPPGHGYVYRSWSDSPTPTPPHPTPLIFSFKCLLPFVPKVSARQNPTS